MSRRTSSSVVSLCLFFAAGVLAAAVKPVPISGKAVRTGVSLKVSALPPARPRPVRKDEPMPEKEIENNEIPRSLGPFPPGDSRDMALAGRVPAPAMPGPSVSFDGLSADDDQAALGGRFEPPDTNGDVGPNHYVQTVNSLFRIYDKTGAPLTAVAKLSDLFAPIGGTCGSLSTGNDGDPIALYDPLADRWLLSEFALPNFPGPPYHQCIAISQTGDPTGAYYLYDYLMPPVINDYPHFGVWPDGYYMSDNQFNQSGTAFAGAGLFAFDRLKMLVGDPSAAFIYFDYFPVDPNAGGMLPTDLDGLVPPPVGTPNFFMEFRSDEFGDPNDALRIYEFHADFASPASSTLTVRPDLVVAAFDARQPGGRTDVDQPPPATSNQYLDSVSDRMMHRVAYRTLAGGAQAFVANWTVNVSGVNPTSSATYQAGIRFEELRRDPGTGAFSIQNQVTYSTDPGNGATGRNLWMGSAAQDNQGNSALGFSASSTTLQPSIVWAGRLAGDPANTLAQGEATMQAGAGVQQDTQARWGDYSAMNVDPSDDCTFFYTQEYYANNGSFDWKTRVGAFAFPGCTASPRGTIQGQVTDCNSASPIAGVQVSTPEGYFATTDAAGNYSITATPGNYTLSFSKNGYTAAAAGAAVTDGGTTNVSVCLTGFPLLGAGAATIAAESCAPPNNALDPGESVTVLLCIQNTGALDTTDLVGTLQASGGVENPSAPQHFGVVPAGGAAVCKNFTFVVGTLCGQTTRITLQLQDGATNFGTVEYDFQDGVLTQTYAEAFDGVVAPNLPSGWVAANATGAAPLWVTSATTPDTAPNDAFVDDPAAISDKRLTSPPIPIASPAAQLSFRNSYNLEDTYDGGVLEIAIGGGAFEDILTAGGSFTAGGYNGTVDPGFNNPLAGQPAWTGNSGGYVTTTVTLPAAANGQNVQLRWRMGSDDSQAGTGWRIDTITLLGGYVCCSAPVPVALAADTHPSSGASNVNGVFEPGEQVVVAPSWMNGGSSASFSLNGIASNYTGPSGATYTLNDSSAGYGTLAALTAADCFGATADCYQMSVDAPAVRPTQHWDASFQETPGVLAPSGFPAPVKTWTLHVGLSFTDTPTSNIFYSFIENIFHNGLTGGCGGTSYCPSNQTLRKQMAVFVLKAKEGAAFVPPAAVGVFTDVPAADPFAPWIEELYNRGVVAGCGAGPTYCPDNPVLRQQMAVFLLKTLLGAGYTPPAAAGLFGDVPIASPFAPWIEDLYNRAITGGCSVSPLLYCPTNAVTRGQMAPFLVKTFGLLLYGP
jgi:hypothetical protein